MKRLLGVLVILCPLLSVCQSPVIKPLRIGEQVPPQILSDIFQHIPDLPTSLTSKPKPLLLDFWATWCTSCLQHFGALDSFQKIYPQSLQVLLVNTIATSDSKERIAAFFQKRKERGQDFHFPLLSADTLLAGLFPHRSLPHYVWISATGMVEAITGSEALTAANIAAFTSGLRLRLPLKEDRLDYAAEQPLLQNGNGGSDSLALYRTVFSAKLEGMSGGIRTTTEGGRKRVCFINQPVLTLYSWALQFPANYVALEVSDSALYYKTGNPASFSAHQFSYEITVPATTPDAALRRMVVEDLNRYLGLNGRIETREADVWILQNSSSAPAALPVKKLLTQPLSGYLEAWNSQILVRPNKTIYLDESGRGGDRITLEADPSNFVALQEELSHVRLQLVRGRRMLPLFILTETNLHATKK